MIVTQQTINCRGTLLDLSIPRVMGILNTTDDSFYDGGQYLSKDQILRRVNQMVQEGVDIVDIGAASSRPGAVAIGLSIEEDRIGNAVQWILDEFPDSILSIDTYNSSVARIAFELGAHILNDISAFREDPALIPEIANRSIPYILMHMQGSPATMQHQPRYQNVVKEILDFFIDKIKMLQEGGVRDILVDPGFGFGKSLEHNYQLLNNLQAFRITDKPICVGLSRKSMIYKVLDTGPEEALNGTTALHMSALERGASILRVHDVKAARQTIQLWRKLRESTYD